MKWILFLFAFLCFGSVDAQFCPENNPDFDCKQGIEITLKKLDDLVNELSAKCASLKQEELTVEDYIELVRISNTVGMEENKYLGLRYIELSNYVNDEVLMEMIFSLEAVATKGGAMWSNKHKILIGGWKHYNSHYVVKS